jgi:hypothetical protein
VGVFDQLLSKYSDAPDTYSKIISFRKQAKEIAQYSNALNRAKPVRKMNKK